jgi:4'-phosphopantetheinyl transferase
MPVLLESSNDRSKVSIWKITESVDELMEQLNHTVEGNKLIAFKFEEKKLQWLTAQVLLLKMCGTNNLTYNQYGKPFLTNGKGFISLTHSKNLVGLVYNLHNSTGIDIQYHADKIINIKSKFVNNKELEYIKDGLPTSELAYLHYLWCCKEAIFKVYGTNLPFKEQIFICPFSVDCDNVVTAIVERGDKIFEHKLAIGKLSNAYYAYIK